MNHIYKQLFNKNKSSIQNESSKLNDLNQFKSFIKGKKSTSLLKDFKSSLKSEGEKEFLNEIIKSSAVSILNPSDKNILESNAKRNAEMLNNKLNLGLDNNDIDLISGESTKANMIINSIILPNHIAINNCKHIATEYSAKSSININKIKANEFASVLNSISYLTSELDTVSSITNTISTFSITMSQYIKKNVSGNNIGVVDVFLKLAANIIAVVRDAFMWDIKKYKGNSTINLLYGLFQRILYACIIVTSVLGSVSILCIALSSFFGTPVNLDPLKLDVNLTQTFFDTIYNLINVVLSPLLYKLSVAIGSTAILKTIKELYNIRLLDIISDTISNTWKGAKKFIGKIFDFLEHFLGKYESKDPDIEDDKPITKLPSDDSSDSEDDESDIFTQIGGLAGSMSKNYKVSEKYIGRSIAHEFYNILR